VVPPTAIACGSLAGIVTQLRGSPLPTEATSTTPRLLAKTHCLGDWRHRVAATEVEAHVDHLRPMLGGKADALGDPVRLAVAEPVQHPHRHQLRLVGEPGQAYVVVGLLGDRPCHVGAVTVDIERQRVLSDEVKARHEFAGAEVGAAMEPGALVPVGNTGVEDGDDGTLGAGRPSLRRFFQAPSASIPPPTAAAALRAGAQKLPQGGNSTAARSSPSAVR